MNNEESVSVAIMNPRYQKSRVNVNVNEEAGLALLYTGASFEGAGEAVAPPREKKKERKKRKKKKKKK